MAARPRPRPRDDRGGRRVLGALEALEARHHGDRRPPRVAERDRGQPRRDRRRVRRGRRAGACAATASPTATAPTAPRRGLAENERFLRGGGRGLVGVHAAFTLLRRDARRGVPGWPPTSASACTSTSPRTPIDAGAGSAARRPRRPTTGCSSTACTSTGTLPGHHRAQPPLEHEQRGRLRPPGPLPNPSCSAPTASAPTCSRSSASRSCRLREHDVDGAPDDRVDVARDRLRSWCPRRATTASRGRTQPMEPWHLAFTTGVRPRRGRVVDGEVVLDEAGPTRVDAAEIRAQAAEQAAAAVREPSCEDATDERRASPCTCRTPTRSATAWRYAQLRRGGGVRGGVAGREPARARGDVPMAAFGAVTERIKLGSGVVDMLGPQPRAPRGDVLDARRPRARPRHPRHRRVVGSAGGEGRRSTATSRCGRCARSSPPCARCWPTRP